MRRPSVQCSVYKQHCTCSLTHIESHARCMKPLETVQPFISAQKTRLPHHQDSADPWDSPVSFKCHLRDGFSIGGDHFTCCEEHSSRTRWLHVFSALQNLTAQNEGCDPQRRFPAGHSSVLCTAGCGCDDWDSRRIRGGDGVRRRGQECR